MHLLVHLPWLKPLEGSETFANVSQISEDFVFSSLFL